jgi:hypothetical protein
MRRVSASVCVSQSDVELLLDFNIAFHLSESNSCALLPLPLTTDSPRAHFLLPDPKSEDSEKM